MDINLPSLGTSVPEARCCKFYPVMHQVYCKFDKDGMAFASIVTLYHTFKQTLSTHRDQQTDTNIY